MAKFKDILKGGLQGFGKYMTSTGRNMGEIAALTMLASKVKRIKREDYPDIASYKKALKKNQDAYQALQEEQVNPQANRRLNKILGVTPEEQQMQVAGANMEGQLLKPRTAIKAGLTEASKLPVGAASFLGTLGMGGLQAAMGAAGTAPKGKEVVSGLIAAPIGAATAGTAYGISKGLSKLGESLLNKTNVKNPSIAGKQATKDWGLKGKDLETLDGWDETRKWATEAYADAKKLNLKTNTRYQKADALSKIMDALDNDTDILINQFDSTGVPAVRANDVIQSLKTNPSLSYAKTKDPGTFEWALKTITDNADESGNISMRNVKNIIKIIQDAAGGFEGATDQSSAAAKQIFSTTRGILRDSIETASPELSTLLSKWSRYIKVRPSVSANTLKTSASYLPVIGRVKTGTAGTEVADTIGSLLSSKGGQGSVTGPTALQSLLGNITGGMGKTGQAMTPAVGAPIGAVSGGILGGGGLPQSEPELGDDDEGMQLIRSSFGESQDMGGLRMAGLPEQASMEQSQSGISSEETQALKQVLAMGILNGQISGSEANAVISLLGLEEDPAAENEDLALLGNAINQMESLYGVGTEDSMSIKRNVGIGGLFNKAGRTIGKGFNQDLMDRKTAYDQQKALAAGILNKARLAGTLNEGEFQVMIANMPNEYSTEEQAANWFNNVRNLFLSNGGYSGGTDQTSSVLEALGLQ